MSFDETPWRAEWIRAEDSPALSSRSRFGGRPLGDAAETIALFRRTFVLDSAGSGRVRVTSSSRHILFVNGVEILRGPIRSSPRELFYDEVDVADRLIVGTNCIAVLVRHYASSTSWWTQPPLTGPGAAGGLLLDVDIATADGSATLASDPSWRVHVSQGWAPVSPTDEISAQLPEVVNAGRIDPGWTSPEFDDSGWPHAVADTRNQFGRRPSARPPAEPFGMPVRSPLPLPEPVRRTPRSINVVPCANDASDPLESFGETLRQLGDFNAPDRATVSLPGRVETGMCWVIDFGRVVSGVVSFRCRAETGARVAVTLVEALEPSALGSANHIEYRARGHDDGYDSLEFFGGRFALVTVLGDAALLIDDFVVTEHPRPRPGGFGFRCDDEALNRLHEVALRTVDLCARDAYMDCPTREQRAWVADSVIHQSVDLTNNSNWSLAVRNVQLLGHPRGDGLLPMVAAADFSDPDFVTIPDASLHWIRTVHNLYRYTGDRDAVAALLPTAESILRWFERFQHSDGLLHEVTGWVLIEWAPLQVEGASATLNGLWGRALNDLAEMSKWLGDSHRADWARRAHSRLRGGFEQFWDARRELYVDSVLGDEQLPHASEHAHAAAVVGDLVPASRAERVTEVLLGRDRIIDPTSRLSDYTPATFFRRTLELRVQPNWDLETEIVAAQPFFRYVVHDALALLGHADALPGLLRDWDALLELGPTALREVWQGQSYAHAWSATPARDLVLHVAGISPAAPGFERVRIAPRLGPLRELAVTAPSPHGAITLNVGNGTAEWEAPRPVELVRPDGTTSHHPAGRATVPWPSAV